jgi:hypothetical protein
MGRGVDSVEGRGRLSSRGRDAGGGGSGEERWM